jgi:hypothetical protein
MARGLRTRWSVVNLATGEEFSEFYMSPENVIKFGLIKPRYEPGQYDIYPADRDGIRLGEPIRAYKRAA